MHWLSHGAAVVLVCMTSAWRASAAVYYVAPPPGGDDTNPGSKVFPWASIQRAVRDLAPGDTVLIRGGVYVITNNIVLRRSGTSNAWITLQGYPGETPVIDATNFLNQAQAQAFMITGCAYVRVVNLAIINSFVYAFHVYGATTHDIAISECRTFQSFGPGVRAQYAQNVRVTSCEIVGANSTAMRPPWSTGGEPPHEAISISSVNGFEVAWNDVHHCGKEAIDIKGTSAHGSVHHNYCHDNPRQGLYVDAWHGLLEDVEFHHNISCRNEWGMAVSVEGGGAELRTVRIHHNLLYRNRGSGVFFSVWGTNGPRSFIEIANNTIVRNGRAGHWAGPTGGIDIKSTNTTALTIVNNICADNYAFEIATFDDPASNGVDVLAQQMIALSNNLTQFFRTNTYGASPYGRVYAWLGDTAITGDPRFVNALADVFHLASNSPAISAGLPDACFTDPDGTTNDLGALFFGHQSLPPAPTRLQLAHDTALRYEIDTEPGRTYQLLESTNLVAWAPNGPALTGNWTRFLRYLPVDDTRQMFRRHGVRVTQ